MAGKIRSQLTPLLGVVAQAQHDQGIAQTGKAQAQAPLVFRLEALFIERPFGGDQHVIEHAHGQLRSEEHTSELQSLMRISYAVFCLKKKNNKQIKTYHNDKNNTH